MLEHLKTGYSNEAVKSETYTAHNTSGDGLKKRHYRAYKGKHDTHNSGGGNCSNRSVSGDSNATNRLTVGGVGADTEYRTCNRAYAVTEKGFLKTGICNEVLANDGGKVLVVCDMLCEYNKSNGKEGNNNLNHCAAVKLNTSVSDFLEGLDKRKVGKADEGSKANKITLGINEVVNKGVEVDYSEVIKVECVTDKGEDCGYNIANADTDNEGNKPGHLVLLLCRANNYGSKSNKSAKKGNKVVATVKRLDLKSAGVEEGLLCSACLNDIAHSSSRKGQTDNSNGGTDDNRGHKLIYPIGADKVNDNSDENISKSGYNRAENDTAVAVSNSGKQRAEEGERAAKEHRALEFGE